MSLADRMNRLAKAALDAGEAQTPEQAMEQLHALRLHIYLGEGWGQTLAGEACFLTALATATRAFLGGAFVSGELDHTLRVPLFAGRSVRAAIRALGGELGSPLEATTLCLGDGSPPRGGFRVRLGWRGWAAFATPAQGGMPLPSSEDNPLAGVAAAALGVNEAFLHARGEAPEAGHRTVGLSLWSPELVAGWRDAPGPALEFLPRELWLVGLGHLGQAYAWTLGLLPYPRDHESRLVLQDFDFAGHSNLSTCLLLRERHVGHRKTRVVAKRLEQAGFQVNLVERAFASHHLIQPGEPTTALFGVDNIPARRFLESADFSLVVEAGLGSGYRDFRTIRLHTFPGPRSPAEVWPAELAVQREQRLGPAYEELVARGADRCGMTQLASKAVATPFVGALAAALVIAEVIRPLHGGGVHPQQDVDLKSLRHRSVMKPVAHDGLHPAYVAAA